MIGAIKRKFERYFYGKNLPSDMKKIVRALQKELLISKLKKLIKTKEQK